jgi:hypothetical protein
MIDTSYANFVAVSGTKLAYVTYYQALTAGKNASGFFVQCGHVLCEFEMVRYRNISKVSFYAQILK